MMMMMMDRKRQKKCSSWRWKTNGKTIHFQWFWCSSFVLPFCAYQSTGMKSCTFICALRKGESLKAVNKNQDRLLWYYIPLHSIMHVGEEEEKKQRWVEIMSMWKREAKVNRRKFCVFSLPHLPIKNFFVKLT